MNSIFVFFNDLRAFIGVYICTFDGPFKQAGNGYFSSWAALFFSASYCFEFRTTDSITNSLNGTPAAGSTGPAESTNYVSENSLDSPQRNDSDSTPYVASSTHDNMEASLVQSEVNIGTKPPSATTSV